MCQTACVSLVLRSILPLSTKSYSCRSIDLGTLHIMFEWELSTLRLEIHERAMPPPLSFTYYLNNGSLGCRKNLLDINVSIRERRRNVLLNLKNDFTESIRLRSMLLDCCFFVRYGLNVCCQPKRIFFFAKSKLNFK